MAVDSMETIVVLLPLRQLRSDAQPTVETRRRSNLTPLVIRQSTIGDLSSEDLNRDRMSLAYIVPTASFVKPPSMQESLTTMGVAAWPN